MISPTDHFKRHCVDNAVHGVMERIRERTELTHEDLHDMLQVAAHNAIEHYAVALCAEAALVELDLENRIRMQRYKTPVTPVLRIIE